MGLPEEACNAEPPSEALETTMEPQAAAFPFELTWAQIRKFRRDGHMVLRSVLHLGFERCWSTVGCICS